MHLIPKKIKSPFARNIFIFIILIFLLILTSVYFVRIFKSYYNSGQLKIHHKNSENIYARIGNIRPWMTFDYLNTVFKLPSDYFKNKLSITDFKYPNIRIDHYALSQKINPEQMLFNIKQLIIQNFNGRI